MSKLTPTQALREILKLVKDDERWRTPTHMWFNLGRVEEIAKEGLKRPPKKKKSES